MDSHMDFSTPGDCSNEPAKPSSGRLVSVFVFLEPLQLLGPFGNHLPAFCLTFTTKIPGKHGTCWLTYFWLNSRQWCWSVSSWNISKWSVPVQHQCLHHRIEKVLKIRAKCPVYRIIHLLNAYISAAKMSFVSQGVEWSCLVRKLCIPIWGTSNYIRWIRVQILFLVNFFQRDVNQKPAQSVFFSQISVMCENFCVSYTDWHDIDTVRKPSSWRTF